MQSNETKDLKFWCIPEEDGKLPELVTGSKLALHARNARVKADQLGAIAGVLSTAAVFPVQTLQRIMWTGEVNVLDQDTLQENADYLMESAEAKAVGKSLHTTSEALKQLGKLGNQTHFLSALQDHALGSFRVCQQTSIQLGQLVKVVDEQVPEGSPGRELVVRSLDENFQAIDVGFGLVANDVRVVLSSRSTFEEAVNDRKWVNTPGILVRSQ